MNEPLENLPPFITVEQAANILSISKNTAYNLVRSRQIPNVKVGRQYRIAKDSFLDYLKRAS